MNIKNKNFLELIIKDWPIKIICIVSAFIIFLFYRRSTLGRRNFSADLKVETTHKLVAASGFPRSVKLTLWGDALNIASIKEEDIEVYLDLNAYSEAGTYKVPLKTRISGTALNVTPLDIAVEPRSIELRLEESATKIVPVYLSLKGTQAGSFELSKITVKPESVEVYGPKSLISKIKSIPTEDILVENRNTSFSGSTKLINTNALISISGAGVVEYQVDIAEKVISRDLKNIPVQAKNLDPSLTIASKVHTVLVTVAGKEAILDAFIPPEDFASLDFSEITEPGEYNLEVKLKEFDEIQIKNVFPDSLAITIVPNTESETEKLIETNGEGTLE